MRAASANNKTPFTTGAAKTQRGKHYLLEVDGGQPNIGENTEVSQFDNSPMKKSPSNY